MSLIGQLKHLDLSLVLQSIETRAKTGLLLVQQEVHRVELYFSDGRLMCIGPVRPNMTLGVRLLRFGIISPSALQDTQLALGTQQPGETRVALTLMDLGHVSHEDLRTWAIKEASGVIQILITWQSGEVYFEDGIQPPADRLLVALSPCSLLPSTLSSTNTANHTPHVTGEVRLQNIQPESQSTTSVQIQSSELLNASQLITETPPINVSTLSPSSTSHNANMFSNAQELPRLSTPQRTSQPVAQLRIDTSFMRPEMVLIPLDLSAIRQQGQRLLITPEQWRVLTRVDGNTTLQSACQELGMPAGILCQVAGELIALGLIRVSLPMQQGPINQLAANSTDLISPAMHNGYVSYGYATNTPQPWVAITPTTDSLPPSFGMSVPFETMSQWGNGGTGAIFVPGKGWVANPQPLQAGGIHPTLQMVSMLP